jgi:hypothetical protein
MPRAVARGDDLHSLTLTLASQSPNFNLSKVSKSPGCEFPFIKQKTKIDLRE